MNYTYPEGSPRQKTGYSKSRTSTQAQAELASSWKTRSKRSSRESRKSCCPDHDDSSPDCHMTFAGVCMDNQRHMTTTITEGVNVRVSVLAKTHKMGKDVGSDIVFLSSLLLVMDSLRDKCLTHLEDLVYETPDADLPWSNTSFKTVIRAYKQLQHPNAQLPVLDTHAQDEATLLIQKLILLQLMLCG